MVLRYVFLKEGEACFVVEALSGFWEVTVKICHYAHRSGYGSFQEVLGFAYCIIVVGAYGQDLSFCSCVYR